MKLRQATVVDIPFIVALERVCPTAAHWTEARYRQAVQPGFEQRFVLVAEAPLPRSEQQHLFGFLVARRVGPEWELENIVVAPAARRNGLGTELLEALITAARETKGESVFLEARESNTAARKLYERFGFEQSGRRKAYYANPREDALVYRLQIAPA